MRAVAACYTMDLYCRHNIPNDGDGIGATVSATAPQHQREPAQFTGETFGECKKAARARGWTFGRDGDVTCPTCSKRPAPINRRGGLPAFARQVAAGARRKP